MQPSFSICVPTFNRESMLRRNLSFHLQQFRALGLPFEIVVVDDCSTDGTSAYLTGLAEPELKVFRRSANSGFLSNYAFAMRRATGRYAVFLGDDDLLIPEVVADCVGRMDADPHLGMIQAPWLCVDERPGAGAPGPFYNIRTESRFAKGSFQAAAQFLFDFHVFPEFMIVRRDVLARSISGSCPFIFWAFLFTGRALAHADVLFSPRPFARVTAVSADPRDQQGHRETMFQWDHYRGGVEYFVSLGSGASSLPLERRVATTDQINRFMLVRQKVALRLHVEVGNWVEAYVLHHRIAAYEPGPLTPEQFRKISQLAGITTAASEAAQFAGGPIVLDPAVKDDVLVLLNEAVRGRLVRSSTGDGTPDVPTAFLRLDPAFPPALGPKDAVFDLTDYMAQFV